jgi:hypothetical protein
MIVDDLSMSLAVASLILGPLTIIIVGSQTREDARSVAIWTLSLLVPMLLLSCASVVLPGQSGGFNGAPGMVMLCSALIAAVGIGCRIAALRHATSRLISKSKKVEPGSRDDELA